MAMTLTDALKAYARQHYGVADGADDATYQQTVGAKLVSGELAAEKYAELAAAKTPDAIIGGIAVEVVKLLNQQGAAAAAAATAAVATPTALTPAVPALPAVLKGGPNPSTVFAGLPAAQGDPHNPVITVKKASERFNTKRYTGKHNTTGQPVSYLGREVEHPSEQMLAKFGAFMRWKFLRKGLSIRPLEPFERELIAEMAHEDEFCMDREDKDDFIYESDALRGQKGYVKALLDDSTSGGQELVPIWFDDMLVTFPLLHSELFPYVEIREVPRSSRVEAASLGNPTVSWGTSEGSAFTLFTTTSLAAAIDTTIHPVFIGVEMGIDFLSDSPVNVGQQLQANIGQAALKEWDNVIVNGNGTNRPQGLASATAGTTVTTVNGSPGPWTITDLTNLAFGIGKQYRTPALRPCYVSNDTTYKRWREIQVGPVDQRRVLGMTYGDYMVGEYNARIQNDLGNGTAFFVCLAKYRLYRRKGFDMRVESGGITLAKTNTVAIIGRGRFGGKIVDSSALAATTTGQS